MRLHATQLCTRRSSPIRSVQSRDHYCKKEERQRQRESKQTDVHATAASMLCIGNETRRTYCLWQTDRLTAGAKWDEHWVLSKSTNIKPSSLAVHASWLVFSRPY